MRRPPPLHCSESEYGVLRRDWRNMLVVCSPSSVENSGGDFLAACCLRRRMYVDSGRGRTDLDLGFSFLAVMCKWVSEVGNGESENSRYGTALVPASVYLVSSDVLQAVDYLSCIVPKSPQGRNARVSLQDRFTKRSLPGGKRSFQTRFRFRLITANDKSSGYAPFPAHSQPPAHFGRKSQVGGWMSQSKRQDGACQELEGITLM